MLDLGITEIQKYSHDTDKNTTCNNSLVKAVDL